MDGRSAPWQVICCAVTCTHAHTHPSGRTALSALSLHVCSVFLCAPGLRLKQSAAEQTNILDQGVISLASPSSGLLACAQRLELSLHHTVLRPPIWRTATEPPQLGKAASSLQARDRAAPTAPTRPRHRQSRRADASQAPRQPQVMVRLFRVCCGAFCCTPKSPSLASTDSQTGSITSSIDRRPQSMAPAEQPGAKPKKPSLNRRTTSSKFPHKGQEFSVDDDVDEILAETEQQLKEAKEQKRQGQTLRRKPSNLRRPAGAAQRTPLTTIDSTEDDAVEEETAGAPTEPEPQPASSEEETLRPDEDSGSGEAEDDDADLSDAESFTLMDRQDAINVTHPFGIRIWKPALYKKGRSVQRNAEADIHSNPGLFVSRWLLLFNGAWTLIFGWWLALLAGLGSLLCALLAFDESCKEYSRLLYHLAVYVFYPFGRYVKLLQDDQYAEEDEGEGRSISEYEQWQSGDIEEGRLFFGPTAGLSSLVGRRRNSIDSTGGETTSLLGRDGRANIAHSDTARTKNRFFGRGKWTFGRVLFFAYFYGVFTPALFLVSGLCWFLVFTIPMGKVTV